MFFYLLLHLLLVYRTRALNLSMAQSMADSLIFFLQAPGNCLQVSSDLPRNAPSKNLAALWIRATFHEAGTFDLMDKQNPGGTDGSLVKTQNQTENAGLMNTIANRFVTNNRTMSNADIIAMGGLVSIGHCGGPNIPFTAGRSDVKSIQFENVKRLPGPDEAFDSIKKKWARMGLDALDMATLVTGSHSMGGVHAAISPTLTNETFIAFDDTPGVFDNDVFTKTLQGHCPVPVDCQIAKDPEMRPYIELFAKNQSAFFQQYSISYQKMLALTTVPLDKNSLKLSIPMHENLVAEGTLKKPLQNSSSSIMTTKWLLLHLALLLLIF